MVQSSDARADFKRVVKGANMMTPGVMGFYYQNNYAVELSTGVGFDGSKIYGVTVVNTTTKEHEYELSKMFREWGEAIEYIKSL